MCSAECQLPNWECCPGNGCIPRCLPRALHSQPPLNCLPHCSKKKGDSEHFLLRRASSWLEMQFVKNKSNHIKTLFLFLFFYTVYYTPWKQWFRKIPICTFFYLNFLHIMLRVTIIPKISCYPMNDKNNVWCRT